MTKSARRATGRKAPFKGGGNNCRQQHGQVGPRNNFQTERARVPGRLLWYLYAERGVEAANREGIYAILAHPDLGLVHGDIKSRRTRNALVRSALDGLIGKSKPDLEVSFEGGGCRIRVSKHVAKRFQLEERSRRQQRYSDPQARWEKLRTQERRPAMNAA